MLADAVRGPVLDHHGHWPHLPGRLRARIGEVPLLGELQLERPPDRRRADVDEWVTRLFDPCVRDGRHVLARRFVESAPKIVGGRVGLGMPPQIDSHALAERLLAEVALDHAEDRGALRVRDCVEPLRRFLSALCLDRDRMRGGEGVEVERARVVGHEIAPVAPLGIERGRRLFADEGGE